MTNNVNNVDYFARTCKEISEFQKVIPTFFGVFRTADILFKRIRLEFSKWNKTGVNILDWAVGRTIFTIR